jgi:hypothetical protein
MSAGRSVRGPSGRKKLKQNGESEEGDKDQGRLMVAGKGVDEQGCQSRKAGQAGQHLLRSQLVVLALVWLVSLKHPDKPCLKKCFYKLSLNELFFIFRCVTDVTVFLLLPGAVIGFAFSDFLRPRPQGFSCSVSDFRLPFSLAA